MDDIAIRLATPADVPSLVELRAAFLAEVAGADPNRPELLDALAQYFSAALPAGEFKAYVAVAGGQIVATSGLVYYRHPPSLKNLSGREAYIMNMYTLPAFRGRGIASELLRRLLARVREDGCRHVWLYVLPGAGALYRRAGFVPVDDAMRLELQEP